MSKQYLTFTINGKLPTLNDYTNRNRTHWAAGAADKKRATALAAAACKAIAIPQGSKIKLHYNWHTSTRHDLDNLVFAQKFCQDGLVSAGKIPDDSRKYIIGFTHDFTIVSKGEDCVIIHIEVV
jgi:Holliday junction resolvase RusA-like endonuclease